MRFQPSIEIGKMIIMNSLALLTFQTGQHITVGGNPGRWVGISRAGTILIVWPQTVGVSRVNWAIKMMQRLIS